MIEEIKIKFNNEHWTVLIIASIAIIAFGIISFYIGIKYFSIESVMLLFFGIILISLFTTSIYLYILHRIRNKYAVILSEDGIYDNSSFTSLGFIKWKNIIEIRKVTLYKKNAIVLIISTSLLNKSINDETNFIKKLHLKLNYITCGTLVTIFENSIDYNFDSFCKIVLDKLQSAKS